MSSINDLAGAIDGSNGAVSAGGDTSARPKSLKRITRAVAGMASAAVIQSALVGCSSFPENADKLPTQAEAKKEYETSWASVPAVTRVASAAGKSVRTRKPMPHEVGSRSLSVDLEGRATLGEIVRAAELQGFRIILKTSSDKRSEPLHFTRFEGTFDQFVEMLAISHDVDFEYMNGVTVVSDGVRYMVTVPQHKSLLERVVPTLTALGATNVKYDLDSGLISYEAPAATSRDIDIYLQKMTSNASMVALQVAVIDVRMNRDRATGFDWKEFSAKWGTAIESAVKPVIPTPTTVGTAVANAVTDRVLGNVGSFSGNGFGVKLDEAKFSLVAAIKLLSTYGQAKVTQDVLISTMGGAPVKLSSGNVIPYVTGIGSTTASGGAVSGSVTTSTVNSGLKMEITPRYDAADHFVMTDLKAKMASLVRFRELSAGNTTGTLSQPEMQELEFENISRLRPGEIILLGGISYDQINETYTSIAGLEKAKIGSEAITTNRHAIFIVIRPSVTIFTPSAGDEHVAQAAAK
ncbi:type II secretion system protein GspD [Acidovorax sp. sic0104]|uniref:type II secretion system protein GspD n=1 Tax=Acidovorax sp. sic0104 TaxID=2854784 RepID=UPI001C48BEB7|nr:hypothetical protein [Acidovorax sp. sic0104]MBV7542133.1 hypothetical protein [Acidovorax sp. sic0104]